MVWTLCRIVYDVTNRLVTAAARHGTIVYDVTNRLVTAAARHGTIVYDVSNRLVTAAARHGTIGTYEHGTTNVNFNDVHYCSCSMNTYNDITYGKTFLIKYTQLRG